MRRPASDLFDRITEFEALWHAARLARRGKRRLVSTARFEHSLEPALIRLQDHLRSGKFHFGGYRTFTVREPVERVIRAAPYRDRVVHHAICRYLEPLLERQMIDHSFACRVGRGTHRALDVLQHFLRGGEWVLKLDIRKYFYTVDHAVLLEDIANATTDDRLLNLLRSLFGTYDAGPAFHFPLASDDLLSPIRPRGLPIGNLTSQLFANAYLTPVDRSIKRSLRVRRYVRYMDDLVLIGQSKAEVQGWRAAIEELLATRRLVVHPTKTQVFPVGNGVPFLGFRVYAGRRRVLRSNLRRFCRRMRRYAVAVNAGRMDPERVRLSLNAWLGYVPPDRHALLIEGLLRSIPFKPPGARLPFTWLAARA